MVPAISPSSLVKPLKLSFSFLLTATLAYVPNSAVAVEDDIGFADKTICVAPIIHIPDVLKAAPKGAAEDQEIGLEGDELDLLEDNKISMTGNAQIVQGARGVYADSILYDQDNYHADLKGNVIYYSEEGDELKTDSSN